MSLPRSIVKAQATGNDFVMYHDPDGGLAPSAAQTQWVCDRHFGVGADGLLRLTRPEYVDDLSDEQRAACRDAGATWFMDYRNADGSLAEMCGNGTRAIALFARQLGLWDPGDGPLLLGTRAGVKAIRSATDHPELGRDVFQVDMGHFRADAPGTYRVSIPGVHGQAAGTFVDMGNPHIVVVAERADTTQTGLAQTELAQIDSLVKTSSLPAVRELDLSRKPVVEPALEHGQNVEFVSVTDMAAAQSTGSAFMRVNERGVGETLSCGTGLCATAVTMHALTGVRHWRITVLGGHVVVDVNEHNQTVSLTGPAVLVGRMQLEQRL